MSLDVSVCTWHDQGETWIISIGSVKLINERKDALKLEHAFEHSSLQPFLCNENEKGSKNFETQKFLHTINIVLLFHNHSSLHKAATTRFWDWCRNELHFIAYRLVDEDLFDLSMKRDTAGFSQFLDHLCEVWVKYHKGLSAWKKRFSHYIFRCINYNGHT